jgi:hypothetical protein
MARPSKKQAASSNLEAYLRSIDIQMDASSADRVEHYIPTEKGTKLVRALLGEESDRTFIIVAPYGSGKSLAASFALHLIENRPESRVVLADVSDRMKDIDRDLASLAKKRASSDEGRGLCVPLSGPVRDIHIAVRDGILEALSRFKLGREARPLKTLKVNSPEDLIPFLNKAQKKLAELGFDRISILWDEFGKHLEYLVQDGRTSQLFHVQKLAEYVARAKMPFSFAVFLHMGLLHYAGSLSQSARTEWRKIEGRFQTFDYVDDSAQIYSLIARLILLKRKENRTPSAFIDAWAEFCREFDILKGFQEEDLRTVISAAYPFTPPALHILPRLTGRIAQNERTLFHFVEHWNGVDEICPADLYDYFSPQMKADITTGGTHKQWLEAQSALQKVNDDPVAEAIIKTTALFGLGTHGMAGTASLGLIKQAWHRSPGESTESGSEVVKALIEKKLLLYRPYKDEVSVWHGSDLDLRSHLDAEKAKRGASFDLKRFLDSDYPPNTWRPLSYNSEYCIRRYFISSYASVEELKTLAHSPSLEGISAGDGHIAFVLPETREQLEEATAIAARSQNPLLVIAIPEDPVPLADAALEVHCLYKLQGDQDLVASDPLALDEIRNLTNDSEAHLDRLLRRCTTPDAGGPNWYSHGKPTHIASAEDLRELLSQLCRDVFFKTPRLNNELINKNSPAAVIVNSRKKLVMGILERSGTPTLGLPDTTPDGSMFRTLLRDTHLYRAHGNGKWGFCDKADAHIADNGLREVWKALLDFVAAPSRTPKSLGRMLSMLRSAPYGVRDGVLPILLAASVSAAGGTTAIRKNGVLVEDLLPSTFEDMLIDPASYTFEPVALSEEVRELIEDFALAIGAPKQASMNAAILNIAAETLIEWRHGLPVAAQTRDFDDEGLVGFRDAVFRATDPVKFLVNDLNLLTKKLRSRRAKKMVIEKWVNSLGSSDSIYYDAVLQSFASHFDLDNEPDLLAAARTFSLMFPDSVMEALEQPRSRHLLKRLRMPYRSTEQLARTLAQLLTEKRIREFDAATVSMFAYGLVF